MTTYRWLLAVLALGYALVSLLLRGPAPRHSEQMVNAAGLAVLISADRAWCRRGRRVRAVRLRATRQLPTVGSSILLAVGCGLIAYGAVDRAPGPAYLGVANLPPSSSAAGISDEETLLYWPP